MTDDAIPEDHLDRTEQLEAFTKIVTNERAPRVISIEAGYGEGKTTFAKLWAKRLEREGHKVVFFDAWATDTASDPMIAFMASLVEACPKENQANRSTIKQVGGAFVKIGRGVMRAGAQHLLKDGFKDVTEGLAEITDTEVDVEQFADKVAGSFSKGVIEEIDALVQRQQALATLRRESLAAIRAALVGQDESKRVYVIVDELDRCRPDYAISLLEGIKHLFDDQEDKEDNRFRFLLMISPQRLEATATSLFGDVAGGEPYFAKFVSLRLRLGRGKIREIVAKHFDALPKQRDWNGGATTNPIFRKEREILIEFVENNDFSARVIEHTARKMFVALSLFEKSEPRMDIGFLFRLSLCASRHRGIESVSKKNAYEEGYGIYSDAVNDDERLEALKEIYQLDKTDEKNLAFGLFKKEQSNFYEKNEDLFRKTRYTISDITLTPDKIFWSYFSNSFKYKLDAGIEFSYGRKAAEIRAAFIRYHIDLLELADRFLVANDDGK